METKLSLLLFLVTNETQ